MRIDKYLKIARIVKRRTICKELAEKGRVTINGRVAKPGTEVKVNDQIVINMSDRVLTIKVTDIKEFIGKDETTGLFEVVNETIK